MGGFVWKEKDYNKDEFIVEEKVFIKTNFYEGL